MSPWITCMVIHSVWECKEILNVEGSVVQVLWIAMFHFHEWVFMVRGEQRILTIGYTWLKEYSIHQMQCIWIEVLTIFEDRHFDHGLIYWYSVGVVWNDLSWWRCWNRQSLLRDQGTFIYCCGSFHGWNASLYTSEPLQGLQSPSYEDKVWGN